MAAWNRAVHDAVHAELRQGKLPILLGGDHCLGIGSISAVARHCRDTGKKLRVLWLDAHADFNTHALTPTGNIHGMPVACLCGYGPAEITGLSGHHPDIEAAWVRQIGIRSVDPGEKRLVHEAGLEVFDMRYLDEMGMRATMQAAPAAWTRTRTCMSASMWISWTPRSRPAWAPPCLADRPTARPSSAWR